MQVFVLRRINFYPVENSSCMARNPCYTSFHRHRHVKGNKMKFTNTINQVREDSAAISKSVNGRAAVIVATPSGARKASYGVQFWTNEMIQTGSAKNTDGTTSTFIEAL
jgi:hypothetical protein